MNDERLDMLANFIVSDFDSVMTRLMEIKREKKLTVEQIAERMGVPDVEVDVLEIYWDGVTLHQLRRYAMALGTRIKFEVIDFETGV